MICEGYVFTPVCLSVQSKGVSASVHTGIHPPGVDTPREVETPQEQTPPRKQTPFSGSRHPPGKQTPPREADTPLRSACWEIRVTSGRYASYWNAYLFLFQLPHSFPTNHFKKLVVLTKLAN